MEEWAKGVKIMEKRLRNDKNNYTSQALAVWLFQIAFTIFILADSYTSTHPDVALKLDAIPDVKIGFTRFISGMIMHVLIDNEIKNGL